MFLLLAIVQHVVFQDVLVCLWKGLIFSMELSENESPFYSLFFLGLRFICDLQPCHKTVQD